MIQKNWIFTINSQIELNFISHSISVTKTQKQITIYYNQYCFFFMIQKKIGSSHQIQKIKISSQKKNKNYEYLIISLIKKLITTTTTHTN